MTPQERRLVDDLFERLATLEERPREADAEQAIRDGLQRAPNATYALVQTVLLQDEALRKADARIRELEGDAAPAEPSQGGFLDSMREAMFGSSRPRGSVPATGGDRPMGVPPGFRTANDGAQSGAAYAQPPQASGGGGGSFLGTAAAAAVGVIGGSLLMNSVRDMLGNNHPASGQSAADLSGGNAANANPWGGDASSSDLARQAGLDNIGSSKSGDQHASAYDAADKDDFSNDDDFDDDADYGDGGDFDLGDMDFA